MKNLDIINNGGHYKTTVLMLAWPIFLEQLLASLVSAADSAMVGSLGAAATASVAINSAPNFLINQMFFALGIGFTSLIARAVGAGNKERARHFTEQAITLVFLFASVLSVVCFLLARSIPKWMGGEEMILADAEAYNRILALSLVFRGFTMVLTAIYRGYGDTRTPMAINVGVNVLNVIGNWFMIYPTRELTFFGNTFTMFGCGWGVAGAAVATSLSGALGGITLLSMTFMKKSDIQVHFSRSFKPDGKLLGEVFALSTPAILERLIMSSAFIVVGRAIASLGTAAVAANNLAGTAESISFLPGFAFGSAATTLFGQAIGARREDIGKRYITETIKIGLVPMVVATAALFFGSTAVMHFFTPDAEVIRMGSVMLRILAVIQIPQMIASVHSGALKGAGDAKTPFMIALVSMWGVRLLGAVLCVHVFHLGLYAVCTCTCVDCVVRHILFWRVYRKESWKKHAVQNA